MGVSIWLHEQPTLPQGNNPSCLTWCGHFMYMWCSDWVIQTISWCYKDHAWGTQLIVVVKNTHLYIINLMYTTIHPSVSL